MDALETFIDGQK